MGEALRLHLGCGRPVDDVVHHRGDPQTAVPRGVHQPGARAPRRIRFGHQGRLEHGSGPGITAGRGQLLVRHQLGLHHHPHRAVEGLDVVADRRDRPLHERHQPGRGHPDRPAGRGGPLGAPVQHAGPEVQAPLMRAQLAVADVERLVVDEEADHLAVGHVDHRLPGLRVPVAGLRVRQRPQLVDAVEVGTRQAVRLSLIQVPAPADVPVGQREDRLGLREHRQVQLGRPQAPRLDRERRMVDHDSSSNLARSATTTSAPCSCSSLTRRHLGLADGHRTPDCRNAATTHWRFDARSLPPGRRLTSAAVAGGRPNRSERWWLPPRAVRLGVSRNPAGADPGMFTTGAFTTRS